MAPNECGDANRAQPGQMKRMGSISRLPEMAKANLNFNKS
jgi:hypothetical protein